MCYDNTYKQISEDPENCINMLCQCIHRKSSIKIDVIGSILVIGTTNSLNSANHLKVLTLKFITSRNSLQQPLAQIVFEHNDQAPLFQKKI